MSVRAVAVVAVAMLAASCTVRTRSDKLPPIDAAVCPSECDSCEFGNSTCMMVGRGTPLTCPAGWNCNVTCSGAGACPELTCGTGRCTQTCQGPGACGSTECASSCQCDVTCNPDASACGTMSCPMRANKNCTNGTACDSGVFPQCHNCP